MTTYAPVPAFAEHKRHPRALLLIVGAHVALVGAVMTVKMDLAEKFIPTVTKVKLLPEPQAPPKEPPPPQPQKQQSLPHLPTPLVPVPQPNQPQLDATPRPVPLPLPQPMPDFDPGPAVEPLPKAEPIRTGPRFATRDSDLKPPYPASKLRSDEEAALRLRLSIDARGRVTAVEPVGPADPVFLAAARRHLIARWRYQPATIDGKPVASSTVITLQFRLEN